MGLQPDQHGKPDPTLLMFEMKRRDPRYREGWGRGEALQIMSQLKAISKRLPQMSDADARVWLEFLVGTLPKNYDLNLGED